MPRYELTTGKNKKFWEIELDNDDLTTTFGDIGGQYKVAGELFENAKEARAAYDKLVAKKLKEGYQLVGKEPPKTPAGGARRYEFSDGSSNKFWQIELAGASFRVTYGKLGSTGQTHTRSFTNAEEAKKAHDALIAEKLRKGYTLAGGKSAKAAPAARATKPARKAEQPVATGGGGTRLAKAIERAKSWMSKNGAEALVKNLAPGATDAALAKAAKKLGFALPAELVELWKLHDGQRSEQNGFIGSLDLLGSRDALPVREDVLHSVRWMLEDEEMVEEAGLRTAEADERWIPFGTRDSDHLVIHAETGRVFRVAKDAPPLSLAAKSLTEFFERYAKGMEKGEYTVEEGFGDVYLAS